MGVQVDVTDPQAAAEAERRLAEARAQREALQSAVGDVAQGWGTADPWAAVVKGPVPRKPHRGLGPADQALHAVHDATPGGLQLTHFEKIKQLGTGDVGLVELVRLIGTPHQFALKTLNKREMLQRNKVARVLVEHSILREVDHPLVACLHATLESPTHLHFLMDLCTGGELYGLLKAQPGGMLREEHALFYVSEVLVALQYIHLRGHIYRDLKPENILVHSSGHLRLTDFDLSYSKTTLKPRVVTLGTRRVGAGTPVAVPAPVPADAHLHRAAGAASTSTSHAERACAGAASRAAALADGTGKKGRPRRASAAPAQRAPRAPRPSKSPPTAAAAAAPSAAPVPTPLDTPMDGGAAKAAAAARGASSASVGSPVDGRPRRASAAGSPSGRPAVGDAPSVSAAHSAAHGSADLGPSDVPNIVVVAEPEARANSFVGTEEYLPPEIVTGSGHAAPADWWSLGILIFELLYGESPFRGARRDDTFDNIVGQPLVFPNSPKVSKQAKDLIARLLVKEPSGRLGAAHGADEIKAHPWFRSVDWALLLDQRPPFLPGAQDTPAASPAEGGNAAAPANTVGGAEGVTKMSGVEGY